MHTAIAQNVEYYQTVICYQYKYNKSIADHTPQFGTMENLNCVDLIASNVFNAHDWDYQSCVHGNVVNNEVRPIVYLLKCVPMPGY